MSASRLIQHIVLSEFDIDQGSTCRWQYPAPVPGVTPDWLAEHMIPEGAHAREMDVTYIFLNRDQDYLTTSQNSSNKQQIGKDDDNTQKDYFLFGINVCFTKFDSNIKRGASVKSLALFTFYPFVETLKWLLYRTLQTYCNNIRIHKGNSSNSNNKDKSKDYPQY